MDFDTDLLSVLPGRPYPFGAFVYPDGVRFTLFSRHATRVWLAIFDRVEALTPCWEFEFDPVRHRVGDVWSIFVRNLPEGVYYKYRADGPWDPKRGHRFNPNIYLLDPYAKAFVGNIHDNTMKGVVVRDYPYWPHDIRPERPMTETVIYETHVRGFTIHSSSSVKHPGTYRGLIEKIPYLKELGITAVELLPVQEFGEDLLGRCSLVTKQELTNYWGYSNIGFFAPAVRYACDTADAPVLHEFREMVHALHQAGIEVILDVVFNHTSEGNELGPTLSFKGLDNAIYYLLDDEGRYLNYSGCGNTLNCGHPVVRDFIVDCLRYWVAAMHIDGFRFDLASILGRDAKGNISQEAPLVKRIAEDPVLRRTKLIAEAWDAAGAYQVGAFGDSRWAEWNGRYRDDVRRYWRGDPATRPAFASRLMGSSDLYAWAGRSPEHSINFVTCHDGFTLHDLVSYRYKHNWSNGEGNRDGPDENFSMNFGVEGETSDPHVNLLRLRMKKNFIATLFLSLGVPMLLGGDEFGRTQRGNNNAFCQDNEISWYDWTLLQKNQELFRLCQACIAFRKANPALTRNRYYTGEAGEHGVDLLWFNPSGNPVMWDNPHETPLACWINPFENAGVALYFAFNNTDKRVYFSLPEGEWRQRIATALRAPQDIYLDAHAAPVFRGQVMVQSQSLMVFSQAVD